MASLQLWLGRANLATSECGLQERALRDVQTWVSVVKTGGISAARQGQTFLGVTRALSGGKKRKPREVYI